ncbi:hypothetical protein V8C43DRAFT_145956 [Trichoderma afarasin]
MIWRYEDEDDVAYRCEYYSYSEQRGKHRELFCLSLSSMSQHVISKNGDAIVFFVPFWRVRKRPHSDKQHSFEHTIQCLACLHRQQKSRLTTGALAHASVINMNPTHGINQPADCTHCNRTKQQSRFSSQKSCHAVPADGQRSRCSAWGHCGEAPSRDASNGSESIPGHHAYMPSTHWPICVSAIWIRALLRVRTAGGIYVHVSLVMSRWRRL